MIKTFTLILACCLICSSCTKENLTGEDISSGGDAAQTELAELTVVFSLPHTASRANDSGNPHTEVGTEAENTVTSATIIMGEMIPGTNAPFYLDYKYSLDKLEKVDNSSTQWKGVIKVTPGYYRIVAIANPPSFVKTDLDKLFWPLKKSWEKLSDFQVRLRSFGQLDAIYTDNEFLMTNAYTANRLEFDYYIQKGVKNKAIINVQRACARIDYNPKNNNTYSLSLISGESGGTVNLNVRFTEAAPVNIGKSFYLFKTISQDEKGVDKTFYASENENNYVADIDWDRKIGVYENPSAQAGLKPLFFSNTDVIDRNDEGDKITYRPLPDKPGKLCYVTENTLPGIETQVNKLSTGILFKAEFEFTNSEFQGLNEVYYYQTKSGQKKVYQHLESLKKDLVADKMIASPDTWTGTYKEIAQCKARKFTRAADGKFDVWYSYWNRHRDNGNNNVMGKMEFAVVRNNIYRLSINSVNSLGYPEEPTGESIWKPAGETPDELPLMLDIKVKVSDWVDRVFDYEI